MALQRVRVILQAPLAPFELGVLHEVFGVDRTDDGVPAFDFRVCTEDPRDQFTVGGGVHVTTRFDLTSCADADLIALPSGPLHEPPSPAVLSVVRAASARGAYVVAVCTAAFTVAAAGLVDGRVCATHWRHADELRERFPTVVVDPDALYQQAGKIVTSAGTAAGIDACLHVVRAELGHTIAARIARRMVIAPHRTGGQRQFLERPMLPTTSSGMTHVLEWLDEHLGEPHTVASIARQAQLSPRTLLRRFHDEVGATPIAWLTGRRVALAQELLEQSTLSIEDVAHRVGFGSGTLLRHHFQAHVGLSPTQYRRQFRMAEA